MTNYKLLSSFVLGLALLGSALSHASQKLILDEARGRLDKSLRGGMVDITFKQFCDRDGPKTVKTRVSPLTAQVIEGDYRALKPNFELIDKEYLSTKRGGKEARREGQRLCEQVVDGIVMATRLDLVEDILNDLQVHDYEGANGQKLARMAKGSEVRIVEPCERCKVYQLEGNCESCLRLAYSKDPGPDAPYALTDRQLKNYTSLEKLIWPDGCLYPEFLTTFVRALWFRLVSTGNESLLKVMHEAHYFPDEVFEDVIDDVMELAKQQIDEGNSSEAHQLLKRVIQRYQNRNVLDLLRNGLEESILRPVLELWQQPLRVSSGLEFLSDNQPPCGRMDLFAAMVLNGSRDEYILTCIRMKHPKSFVTIEGKLLPVALFLLEAGRRELLNKILAVGGAAWMMDANVHDYLLRHRHMRLLEQLLGRDAFEDSLLRALIANSINFHDVSEYRERLTSRAFNTCNSDAMSFLLISNQVDDLNDGEYEFK